VSSDNARILLDHGIAAARDGDWEAARPLLREVTELDPENELSWLWLAAVSQSDREAISHLERVLEINPKNSRALAGIADIKARTGIPTEPTEAREARASDAWICPLCLGKLQTQASKCSACGAILTLTEPGAFLKSRDADPDHLQRAIARLEKSYSNDPSYETSFALGLAHLNALHIDKALIHLEAALLLNPEATNLKAHLEMLHQLEPRFRDASADTARRGRILIVDDSPTVRKLVEMTLERDGHDVVAAEDGMDALARINDGMPDLILLDISMPRMDGYQLCRTLKSNQATSHIPVIMLTGKDGLIDKMRGRMAGSGDYLTKPFEPKVLVDMVEKHLGSVAASQ
jgi:twitching motility two-component system response regulator PilG